MLGRRLTRYPPEALNNSGAENQKDLPSGDDAQTGDQGEDPKPAEQDSGAAAANGQEHPAEDKSESLKAGDKREHDSATTPADAEKPAAEDSSAPDAKKQKTSEVENGAPAAEDKPAAAETNGEKKKGGRPKKTGAAGTTAKAKKERAIPTDGIGSRTRSRTKAA